MKKSSFIMMLSTLLMIETSGEVFSQNQSATSLTKFLILIETTNNGIKLTGKEGCAFKELTFSIKPYNKQAINQYGMMPSKGDTTGKTGKPSSFAFSIEKTDSGISLEGINGTAWTTLTFKCQKGGCYQFIDELGMTKEN